MSDIGIMTDLVPNILTWLAVTILLGGPAAVVAGRALAHAWRPFGRGILYAALLSFAVDFLCYALFDLAVIPASRLIDNVASRNATDALIAASGWIATFAILLAFAFAGWAVTRRRQMRHQYAFLYAGSR